MGIYELKADFLKRNHFLVGLLTVGFPKTEPVAEFSENLEFYLHVPTLWVCQSLVGSSALSSL